MARIEFAPLSVPLPRRLQTATIFLTAVLCFSGPMLSTSLFLVILFSPLSFIAILYAALWFLFDYDLASRGGRRFEFARRLGIWKYYCSYFPIKLVKTHDLPTDKNYLFGYHPHGVISSGCFGNFGTEATGFSELFPGIRPHPMTLKCKWLSKIYFIKIIES